jgi:hypothetical protein
VALTPEDQFAEAPAGGDMRVSRTDAGTSAAELNGVDLTSLPPGILQLIQQSGISGGELTQMIQQLQQMSPEQLQQLMEQYGIEADPDEVQQMLNGAGTSGTPPTGEQEEEVAAPDDDEA